MLLQGSGHLPPDAVWMRQVPVSFDLAPIRVESEIRRSRPRTVICCGMAEKRTRLSVERLARRYVDRENYRSAHLSAHLENQVSNAVRPAANILQTSVNVERAIAGTVLSEISEDAGTYVCNHLYYSVLDLVEKVDWEMSGVFIHIPVLNSDNQTVILQDFVKVIDKISDDNG